MLAVAGVVELVEIGDRRLVGERGAPPAVGDRQVDGQQIDDQAEPQAPAADAGVPAPALRRPLPPQPERQRVDRDATCVEKTDREVCDA
ncbi:MAG: hypothetical protein JXR83_16810 [Deltaproteobacteria bacterium]|nr:hypothetical protein [Deltaproteobacteria bacterium]